MWVRCSQSSIFDRRDEFREGDVQGDGDASDCCPVRVGVAALDSCERGDCDPGAEGDSFLSDAFVSSEAA